MKPPVDGAKRIKSLLIIAGEQSGDAHGAALVRDLRKQEPRLHVAGLGGPKMAAEGVELIRDFTAHAIIGLGGLMKNMLGFVQSYRAIRHRLSVHRPDAIILIDFPDFNLLVAQHAKRVGVPVIYYISPHIWAWRRGRMKKIVKRVRKMLVFFEFEKELYERAGVDVTLVGHPLLDTLAEKLATGSRAAARRSLGLAEAGTVIGILPGSRRKEIELVFPILLKTAEIMQREMSDLRFVSARAAGLDAERFRRVVARHGLDLTVVSGRAHDVMLASNLLLTCSGTATLEAGLLGTPMVVTYRADMVSYMIFGPFISPADYALVNIAAGERIVPEFYLFDAKPRLIAATALEMLRGDLDEPRRKLAVLRQKLGQPGASARAAAEILKLI